MEQNLHFEKDKKDLCLSSYTVQTKSKGKKNVVILSTTRPMHSCTKDDDKSKPQIFKNSMISQNVEQILLIKLMIISPPEQNL